ncbi:MULTISPECIES: hypothetical protein [Acinetobacter]|uniref:hypothetical protein n=1 Tax=Acinetobacter TaxID=469 RepID=UPI00135A4857|nr:MULTISPECIES: hypothetical protein [Acinetobacter]MDM1341551.1 hypothetical protein [Acinetobacter pseudolwoffii]
MDTITIFTLIISLMALLVTYAVFKSDQQPQIIVFALPHYGKQSFIQLQIKNIGKSIAYNVQISSDQPIPKRAFGIKKLNASKDYFDSGIFKHGVKVFPPNQSYIYDWGQYGGLREALDNNPITMKVTYWYQHPLNLWKTQITDISIIDINELEALPSSDGGFIEQLQNINKELKILNTKLEKKL